jgi:hypothetical protein
VYKYELYFAEFYPETDRIRKSEALEHHIHAYLEDLDILRNKVCYFLGLLKNDLKRIAISRDEINAVLEQFIRKVFDNVSKNRNPHHHEETRFLDNDLVTSDAMHLILQDNNPFKKQLQPGFLAILRQKEADSFEKARLNWIALAKKNSEQVVGFVDEVFNNSRNFLYDLLGLVSLEKIYRGLLRNSGSSA